MQLNYEDHIIDRYARKYSRRMCFLNALSDGERMILFYSKQAAGLVHQRAVLSVPNMSSTLDFHLYLLEVV